MSRFHSLHPVAAIRSLARIIIALAVIFAVAAGTAANAMDRATKDLLYRKYASQLENAALARDSLRILYNMFDLSSRQGQLTHSWEILHTAVNANDINAQLDMLRTLATFNAGNDSIIDLLLRHTDAIPNKAARESTRTYILNQYFARKNRQINNPEIQAVLLDSIMKSHDLKGHDIYDEISVIYQIIQFLGVDAEGVLFRQSLDTYEALIEKLSMSDFPLKSQFLTTVALIHSRLHGDQAKAVQADRNMLALMKELEDMYRKQNRPHRDYDINRFISYRRMLSNFEGLSSRELEEVHDSILILCDKNPDLQSTIRRDGHPSGFYHMARHEYDKALPLLKDLADAPFLTSYQRQKYYRMIMDASKNTGDRQAYVDALEKFIRSSMEIDSIRDNATKKESILRDSILHTPLLTNVANQNRTAVRRSSHTAVTLMAVSTVIALLLLLYIYLYVRLRLKKSRR